MPSPFPGMNPYFERPALWEAFHHLFITQAAFQLAEQAGDKYIVAPETRLILHELSAEERRYFGKADVGLSIAGSGSAAGAALASPGTQWLEAPVAVEEIKVPYLEIRDLEDRRVVTAIELLSPSNKNPGSDREAYLAKRRRMIRSNTHFLEIDLRRAGPRMEPGIAVCDYAALLKRNEAWPRLELWTWRLRDPMPRLPVPVDAPDPDLTLDLKAVLDEVHDRGRYAHHLYRKPPEPALSAEDAAWAEGLLAGVASA